MKLQFKADAGFDHYHVGENKELKDGEVFDFQDGEANRLLSTFPGNFKLAEGDVKQAEAPATNKAERAPKSNK